MTAQAYRRGEPSHGLSVRGLVKEFAGVRVLDQVSFDVQRGAIHALAGGNGSGKSTTIKILAGVYQADHGSLTLSGEEHDATLWSPAKAKDAGLRFVHQQESWFPELSITENLAIGYGFSCRLGKVRWRDQHREAQAVLERFGIEANPRSALVRCGVATRTMVAIARALQDVVFDESADSGHRVLVLDEPTAALPAKEEEVVLEALTRLAREGHTILYVTHRLEEIVRIADYATVLRDGCVAGRIGSGQIDHDSLVALITGGAMKAIRPRSDNGAVPGATETRIACKGLSGGPVQDASLEVRAGEIVALAGLLGSGRSGVLRLITGDRERRGGRILLNGEEVDFAGPREACRAGIAYVPEDRRRSAAFLELSVRENVGIASVSRYFRGGILRHRAEARDAAEVLMRYQVRALSTEEPLSNLSGGNQQKALLARWLRLDPQLLLLDEPTQGVDVGARREIWQLVRDAVTAGAAALVVLSDFEELVRVCDRVIVVAKGNTVTEANCSELSENTLEQWVLVAQGEVAA